MQRLKELYDSRTDGISMSLIAHKGGLYEATFTDRQGTVVERFGPVGGAGWRDAARKVHSAGLPELAVRMLLIGGGRRADELLEKLLFEEDPT